MKQVSTEDINLLIETQLREWPEAHDNFFKLRDARRRPLTVGDLKMAVQHNPARIRSTGAKIDAGSIAARPCFLCSKNRPEEQITTAWIDGWELLVNPYPILPVHFTIPAKDHRPQSEVPIEMVSMAEMARDLVFFFNGAHAGASAPDHMHAQAVLKSELPLLRIAERCHPVSHGGFVSSESFGIDLPFQFISGVITPDRAGMLSLARIPGSFGIDDNGRKDTGLVNAFFWTDPSGLMRALIVPRRAHRPSCYFAEDESRMMISPGAIDMAGLIVAPREEDFVRIDEDTVRKIYAEVAYADKLPEPILEHFKTSSPSKEATPGLT